MANSPGTTRPSRTPRSPSIGFASCIRRTAVSRVASRPGSAPSASARATRAVSSASGGRNSCSGGSSSRMVTGRPSIAARMPTKSARCSGSSAASAASSSSGPSARISRSTSSRRSPRNMCSVRHSPMPVGAEPPRPRGRPDGVSAFARTPSSRTASAWPSSRCTAATSGSAWGAQLAGQVAGDGGGLHRHLTGVDPAGGPVDRDHLAGSDRPVADGELAALRVDVQRVGPADAGPAHAPGHHGGVRGLAAAAR